VDVEHFIGTVLKGAMSSRRKRRRGAMRYLTGRTSRSLLTPSTLLAAAGVAWGLYETMKGRGQGATAAAPIPAGAPPPIPASGAGAPSRMPSHPGVPDEVARVVRLAVSAARVDGTMSPEEEQQILEHARQVGAEGLVAQEFRQPTPLEALVAGVSDATQRSELYAMAFAIVRADEAVSGGERIYLAQLAHRLGLDAARVAEIERTTGFRIEEAARDGGDD
jgi:uncharacterized membrane protein YebE (DUF533 family)